MRNTTWANIKKQIASLIMAIVMIFAGFSVEVLATATPSVAADSATAIQGAITWAESHKGEVFDKNMCLEFVKDAYAAQNVNIGSADSAVSYWKTYASGHHADANPPAGALVFWGATPYGNVGTVNPYGHVALSLGNGTVVSTYERSDDTVHEFMISSRNAAGYPYLGWMMPPGVSTPSASSANGSTGTAARASDLDRNGASDLVLTTGEPDGGTAAITLLSTWQGFLLPHQWWHDTSVGWSGAKPLTGDMNGDGQADYVFLADNGGRGTNAYVALSTGSGFSAPQLWWQGTGWGFSGIKASIGDVDANGAADLVLVTDEPSGGSAAYVLRSTWRGFLPPSLWWRDPSVGWRGITPLIGDFTGERVNGRERDDFAFLANNGTQGSNFYVAASTGAGFQAPQLWWRGDGWGYSGIKPVAGDADGNGADDLLLVTDQSSGGSAAFVLLSTWQGLLAPSQWWHDPSVGWAGITPMLGDVTGSVVNGNRRDDFVFMANGGSGSPVYVAASTGGGFAVPRLWWNGSGYGYGGIKPVLN